MINEEAGDAVGLVLGVIELAQQVAQRFVRGQTLELDRDGRLGAFFDIDLPAGLAGDFLEQGKQVPRLNIGIHLILLGAPIQGIGGQRSGGAEQQREPDARRPTFGKPSHGTNYKPNSPNGKCNQIQAL